jgi:nicotinamide riboside kinase
VISPSTDSPFNHPDHGASFHWLVPAARAELARRVVLVGAESTGKSTLARALAEAFETVRVPEHGRWYWEGRRYLEDQTWTNEEFRRIAARNASSSTTCRAERFMASSSRTPTRW